MAIKYGYLDETLLVDIADAIRAKTSKAETLSLGQMPSEILSIETGNDTSDATATAADLLSGKTAYSNGHLITGTIPSKVGGTYSPSDTQQVISQGQYLSGDQVIEAVTADNLPASVFTSRTSDATATAADILSGKTAYVNGSLVTGSVQSKETETFSPSATQRTISQGQYLSGDQVIEAVTADNLPSSLFQSVTVDAPLTGTKTVTPSTGRVLSSVTINASVNGYTGSVDEDGLRQIGWNFNDIEYLKENICWMAESNPYYAVTDNDIAFYKNGILNIEEAQNWGGLKYLPKMNLDDTQTSLDLSNMPTLVSIPVLNTENVTSITFANDISLVSVPPLNISSVTNLDNCFSGCRSLFRVPEFDYSRVQSMNRCFSQCNSITSIPGTMDISSLTGYTDIFYDDFAIKSISGFIVGSKTEFDASILNNCSLPLLAFEGVAVSAITNAYSLQYIKYISYNSGAEIKTMTGLFNSPNLQYIEFGVNASFTGIESPLGMPTYMATESGTYGQSSTYHYIHKSFQSVDSVRELLTVMDRGVPSFANPSMYFEEGFTITAIGTVYNDLMHLVESCVSKGWNIYNLTIIEGQENMPR